ncbi:MAG: fibronectin type III domain-containing protein, partial [Capsulimonadaceae bacterium]
MKSAYRSAPVRTILAIVLIIGVTALCLAGARPARATEPIPAAPTGLSAVAGALQVALTWNTSTMSTSYNVYRGTVSGHEGTTPIGSTGPSTTAYTDSGLTAGQTYYYKVAAVDVAGTSPLSSEVNATPGPTGLTATGAAGQVGLAWTPCASSTSYNVYRGTAIGGENATPIATDVTAAAYTDSGLAGGTYYYKVASVNALGTSGLSNEASATTLPVAPVCFTIQPVSKPSENQLDWVAGDTSATSFSIYRSTVPGGEGSTPIGTVAASTSTTNNQQSYTDSTAGSNILYYYKVAGVNGAGTGMMSAEASAEPGSSPLPLPTAMAAQAGNGQAILTWTPVPNATGYLIVASWPSNEQPLPYVATVGAVSSYTVSGAANGVEYAYRVMAIGPDGLGYWDASWNQGGNVVTPGDTPIAAPSGFHGTASGESVTLGWTAPANQSGAYYIYRGTSSGHEVMLASTSGTSYTDTAVSGNTTYYYEVAGYNGANTLPPNGSGEGSYSTEISATVSTGSGPAAPTGLTATAGNAQVSLTWASSTGATSYNVYRGTAAGSESTTPITSSVTATAYTDSSVTNGTEYFYEVAAVNAGGTSALSNEASATPHAPTPAAPAGLTATPGNVQVSLTWTSSTGATSYNVYRGTATGAEGATPITSSVTATAYTDASVTNNTTYFYKVAAVNTGGTSGMSNESSATPVPPVPAAPSGLAATPGNGQVSLSWTSSTGATSYNVYRGTATGAESATPLTPSSTTTTYTDATVINGTTYFYKVAAVNQGGTSGLSNEASTTPNPPAPSAPTGLTATPGNAQVSLSWSSSTGATSYNVYRGTATGAESATPIATSTTSTAYTDASVTNGTTYFYKVAAVNAGGTSGLSNEGSATPNPPAPSAPTGLTATPGNAQVGLTWASSTGATSYNVYRGTATGTESPTPIATDVTTAAYTNTGLTNGTTYFYKVAAVNTGGTSGMSNEASATPVPPAPAAPTGLTATPGNAQVGLSWTSSTGATSYNVYRGTATGAESATP